MFYHWINNIKGKTYMSIIDPVVLKGFRDNLPEIEIEKNRIIYILENLFKNSGFVPIDTPILEYSKVLLGKGSGETDKQIYRFKDHGDRDVSMRFDLTVPFARYMAAHINELYLPFKRYHIAKVWRGENTQKGRYREFMQCDFDIVGVDSASSDLEILLLMYDSFKALNIDNIEITVAHRGIFNKFLEKLGILDHSTQILRTVDKLSKIGYEKVSTQLNEITNSENVDKILSFIKKEDSTEQTLEKISSLINEDIPELDRVKEIFSYITELGLKEKIIYDPSITRGLDYYTGIVFETFLTDLKSIGSVCSGGRYNNLASLYTKQKIPGIGASIGLDRLMAALIELDLSNKTKSYTNVLILNMDQSLLGYYYSLARHLKAENISCEVFPTKKKMNQQFNFTEKKEIPIALICGEDERKSNTITIKDLNQRKNYSDLSLEQGILKIKEILNNNES